MRLNSVFGWYGTMIDSKKPINGKKLNGKCLPLSLIVQTSTLSALPVMLLCCIIWVSIQLQHFTKPVCRLSFIIPVSVV